MYTVKYFYAGFLGEAEPGDDPEANASLFVSLLGKNKDIDINYDELQILSSVADPHWFQCGSGSSVLGQCGSEYGSGSRSRVLMTKFTDEKQNIFLIKNCNLLIPRPP
jgi:hypothetical protein